MDKNTEIKFVLIKYPKFMLTVGNTSFFHKIFFICLCVILDEKNFIYIWVKLLKTG